MGEKHQLPIPTCGSKFLVTALGDAVSGASLLRRTWRRRWWCNEWRWWM